jgi:hypothetical protein
LTRSYSRWTLTRPYSSYICQWRLTQEYWEVMQRPEWGVLDLVMKRGNYCRTTWCRKLLMISFMDQRSQQLINHSLPLLSTSIHYASLISHKIQIWQKYNFSTAWTLSPCHLWTFWYRYLTSFVKSELHIPMFARSAMKYNWNKFASVDKLCALWVPICHAVLAENNYNLLSWFLCPEGLSVVRGRRSVLRPRICDSDTLEGQQKQTTHTVYTEQLS